MLSVRARIHTNDEGSAVRHTLIRHNIMGEGKGEVNNTDYRFIMAPVSVRATSGVGE